MMKRILAIGAMLVSAMALSACWPESRPNNAETRDNEVVQRQQAQYQIGQPVPAYDWSLERDLLIQLYNVRNQEVTTHSVWRSDYGIVEGDCPSMGYGLPYDTSLTNPMQAQWAGDGYNGDRAGVTIGQAEPNGVYASTNTSATCVFCIGTSGTLEPVYVESKVTVYPGPVDVDYAQNLVVRRGDATVNLTARPSDGAIAE